MTMTNNEVNTKIKVLNTRGFPWIVRDLLDIISDDLNMEREATDDMNKIVSNYIRVLRNKYKKQVKQDEAVVQTRDIEDLINELRLENYAALLNKEKL